MEAQATEAPTRQMPTDVRPYGRRGRIAAYIGSGFMGAIGLVVLLGGLGIMSLHAFTRNSDGNYETDSQHLQAHGYALATDRINIGSAAGVSPDAFLGTVHVEARSATRKPVFVGVAPTTDVDRYLRGVRHSEVTDLGDGSPGYSRRPGRAARGAPATKGFWTARAQGFGEQRVDWDVGSGDYSIVVMNADASPGVAIDATAAAKLGWLLWVGVGLTIGGLVLTGGAVALTVVARRSVRAAPC